MKAYDRIACAQGPNYEAIPKVLYSYKTQIMPTLIAGLKKADENYANLGLTAQKLVLLRLKFQSLPQISKSFPIGQLFSFN